MFRSQRDLNRLFLPLALMGFHVLASQAFAQQAKETFAKAKETFAYAPPTVSLAADRTLINASREMPLRFN